MSSFHMHSMSQSAPESFSRAGAWMNRMMIMVGAEPNSALVWLEIGWVVPGRNLPYSELRLFARWERLKLMHAGPDPAEIYSHGFNTLHSEQSLENRWQYFRYFSDSQHHSVTYHPDLIWLPSQLQMRWRRILEVGDRGTKPETLRGTEVPNSQRRKRNDRASASELRSQRR